MSSTAGLRDFLMAGRNADGGWGYSRGKASRLEPTCWALLALQPAHPNPDLAGVLEQWPIRDGLLLERADGEPNYAFHALALIALEALSRQHSAGNGTLVAALQHATGIALGRSTINRQQNSLKGWSWIPDTFSWVEPTAWGLLALRKSAGAYAPDPARLAEAQAVLLDRMCGLGGWNYGNSNMLGRELHPYVPTTAIALLALQGTPDAAIYRSRDFLAAHAASEQSSYALSLSLIASRVLGIAADGLTEALDRRVSTTCDLGQHLGAGQALYALTTEHDHAAFRL